MNLYALTFTHLSQKDSESGIFEYKILTPEQALAYVMEKHDISEDTIYFDGNEDDGYYEAPDGCHNMDDVRELILNILSDNQSDEYPTLEDDNETFVNYDDLYYGKTFYGYKLIKENISDDEIEFLKGVGILKTEK